MCVFALLLFDLDVVLRGVLVLFIVQQSAGFVLQSVWGCVLVSLCAVGPLMSVITMELPTDLDEKSAAEASLHTAVSTCLPLSGLLWCGCQVVMHAVVTCGQSGIVHAEVFSISNAARCSVLQPTVALCLTCFQPGVVDVHFKACASKQPHLLPARLHVRGMASLPRV